MNAVLTFSEHPRTALELFTAAGQLGPVGGGEHIAAWVGPDMPEDLVGHAARQVIQVQGPGLEQLTAEGYAEAIASVVAEFKPKFVLVGATREGKDIAARLAARLNIGAVSEATHMEAGADGALMVHRTFLSGNAVQVVRVTEFPVVVTLQPRAFALPSKGAGVSHKSERKVTAVGRSAQVVSVTEKMKGGIKIEDAQFIISAGRGFKKKDDLKLVEDLAHALGAEVGCSRPLATDLAWMTEDHWVGLSGHKVAPKVYLTLGISGQIQHIAGIRDSQFIISVNNDPNAPIFKNCDLGVVADLFKFIPALKAEAAKAKH